jgi:hypothetical protein
MKLTTSFPIPESLEKIKVTDTIMSVGSCFSENMGNLLDRLPMHILNQPLGTLFHPFSIQKSLEQIELKISDCIAQDGLFVHPDFHSHFTSKSAEGLILQLKKIKEEAIEFCHKADWLIITWGTAFYYFDKALERPIANCHKQPSQQFEKKLSTVEEIKNESVRFFEQVRRNNPEIKIILTVSPVRHTRDGMMENSVSKSTLRVAAAEVSKELNFVHYFPSYEIMMDELRDYRFYEADLIHPNNVAITYIWDRFKSCFFDSTMQEIEKKWSQYFLSIQHRVHPEKRDIQLELLMTIVDEIKTNYSHLPIQKTEDLINSRILSIS